MFYQIFHFTWYYVIVVLSISNYCPNTIGNLYIMCIQNVKDNVNPGQYDRLKLFEIIVGEIFSDPKDG